jgi:uncharacterized membrane protein
MTMFDTVLGLPLHPLVVHFVAVMLPLAAIGALAVVAVPRWNRRYGLFVVAAALLATGSAFVAKESGEVLASRVGLPAEHYSVARWLPWVSLVFLVVLVGLWWIDRPRPGTSDARVSRRQRRTLTGKSVAVLTVVAALVSLGWTYRAGETGAQAVWGKIVVNTVPGTYPVP